MAFTLDQFLAMRDQIWWTQVNEWRPGQGRVQLLVWTGKQQGDPLPRFYLEANIDEAGNKVAVTLYANVRYDVRGRGRQVVETVSAGDLQSVFDGRLATLLTDRYGVSEPKLGQQVKSRYNPLRQVYEHIRLDRLINPELNAYVLLMLNLLQTGEFQVQSLQADINTGQLMPNGDHRQPPVDNEAAAQQTYNEVHSGLVTNGFQPASEANQPKDWDFELNMPKNLRSLLKPGIQRSGHSLIRLLTAQNVTTPSAASLEPHVGSSSMDVSQIAAAFAGTRDAVSLAQQFDAQLFLNVACVFRANGPFFGVYIPAVDQAKHIESVQQKLRSEGYMVQVNPDGSFRAWSKNPQEMPQETQHHIDELDQTDKLKGGNLFGINIDAIKQTARNMAQGLSQEPEQQEKDFYDIAVLNLASTMVHEAVHADTVASQATGNLHVDEALKKRYGANQGEGPSEAAQRSFMDQMIPELNRRRASKNLPPIELTNQTVHAANWYQMVKTAGRGGHSKSCVLALLPDLGNLCKLVREDDLYHEEEC